MCNVIEKIDIGCYELETVNQTQYIVVWNSGIRYLRSNLVMKVVKRTIQRAF